MGLGFLCRTNAIVCQHQPGAGASLQGITAPSCQENDNEGRKLTKKSNTVLLLFFFFKRENEMCLFVWTAVKQGVSLGHHSDAIGAAPVGPVWPRSHQCGEQRIPSPWGKAKPKVNPASTADPQRPAQCYTRVFLELSIRAHPEECAPFACASSRWKCGCVSRRGMGPR